jgi:hypothetical protein
MTTISFMSEHSIEYCLVLHLVRVLSSHYKQVVPFYYWKYREGNNIARSSICYMPYILVAVYPRRPKVESASHGPLEFKFNSQVLLSAKEYRLRGILVLAGMPLISGLGSYKLDSPCVWFEIIENNDFKGDLHIYSNIDGELVEPLPLSSPVMGHIGLEEIPDLVINNSELFDWPTLVNKIDEVRIASRRLFGPSAPWFSGGYKPFYILLGANA